MAGETVFQFPVLEVPEIVHQLRNLASISVEENDFKRPDVTVIFSFKL